MSVLRVRGGEMLRGVIPIHGAKNSALPILAATLLSCGRCVICGCPDIADVRAAGEILRHLGCEVERVGTSLIVDSTGAKAAEIPPELMGKMRASLGFFGATLSRFGRGRLCAPGGCRLGARPVDYHVAALSALGAEWSQTENELCCNWEFRVGGDLTLPFPSVGATETVLLAAVSVPAVVTLHGAAREPEIADLCGFLTAMGAEISGVGTSDLTVRGGRPLHGAVWRVLPDRMETASYLAAAAAAGGDVTLTGTDPTLLAPVLETLRKAGCRIDTETKKIRLVSDGYLRGIGTVTTAPYPGFPTDAQAPVMAALLRAKGESVLCETVFPDRFSHVPELRRFGAEIALRGRTATVAGVEDLTACEAAATDLRGGMAVLIAALCADGVSTLRNIAVLDRGYENWVENFRLLGADVQRTEE